MKRTPKLTTFLKPLSDLQKLFRRAKCKGIIIGGIASNLIGKPRFTADIDALTLLEDEDIPKFLELAKKIKRLKKIS